MRVYHVFLGIGIVCLLFLSSCIGCGDGESVNSENYEYEESSNGSYGQQEVSFSDEQDVRTYLCSHSFSSNDGYSMTFSNNANYISLNGQQLTSSVRIQLVSRQSAVLRTQSPYGNAILTFNLTVSGSDGVLRDIDGETYYSN